MTSSREQLREAVTHRLGQLAEARAVRRVWEGDPTLWVDDPRTPELSDRLGWLTIGSLMAGQAETLQDFGREVREGFDRVVLLGMGGSSLAPEVLWRAFGRQPGYPAFQMLDSTDPRAVRAVEEEGDLDRSLFIVASKSGTTIETASFYQYFWERTGRRGRQFVAITDSGTSLERLGRERGFRRVFCSASDVGGRYAALSLFGLVPAALMGIDVARLLERAEAMAHRCGAEVPPPDNPGAAIGALMAEAALAGRDKLTFILSPALATFGLWAEQLIAESTGKGGKGIVPVVCGSPSAPLRSCADRCFVAMSLEKERHKPFEERVRTIESGGHPLARMTLADPYDLGAEFFRWEFATAIAGAVLRVNPFDQPNVAESKANTGRVLAEGHPIEPPGRVRRHSAVAFQEGVESGDYVCVQAFLPPTPAQDTRLRELCVALHDRIDAAITTGYGPRYLHSTGQLHKGGPPTGHFLQIIEDPGRDLAIPGADYTFGQLLAAQAYGDYLALGDRGRPVLRIADPAELMEHL